MANNVFNKGKKGNIKQNTLQNTLHEQSMQNIVSETETCLGKTFSSAEEKRVYFSHFLSLKLKEHEFRISSGFPHGTDDEIVALSNPPYYCACPNPWIPEFIEEWERQKTKQNMDKPYHRDPFAADVSEGRSGIFYDAHTYHTKVPHKAIMRFILHYTEPGDIVFDGFCGTGMTGVAAQMCGNPDMVRSLGYQVKDDGSIWRKTTDAQSNEQWLPFSTLGTRHAILNDLSPAATFIASNYNTPITVDLLQQEIQKIFSIVESKYGWMYETQHRDEQGDATKQPINYIIWSDVFICPECTSEIIFWEDAIDKQKGEVRDSFHCKSCNAVLTKRTLERVWVTNFDIVLQKEVQIAKQVPVLINYSIGKKRFEKKPDAYDFNTIKKIEQLETEYTYPTNPLPDGFNTRQPMQSHGILHVHQFYTKRNLFILSALRAYSAQSNYSNFLNFLINSYDFAHATKMTRIIFKKGSNKPVLTSCQTGTLYISSLPVEKNILQGILKQKQSIIMQSLALIENKQIISTGDASKTNIPDESIDYIFLDPPFGANLNYSELNFLWESWLKVHTDNKPEAIENSVQKKGINEYRQLITQCFKEAYRVLKPGRWMTVEFSNTKASVWNNIQTALTEAGFIVANVSALDKKQGSFKAVTTPTAVKQDLVISAYKPNGGFEERFEQKFQSEEGVWEFIRTHLGYLPVTKKQDNVLMPIPERDPRLLYDQIIAYYVRKGYNVPIDSQDFQLGLLQRFAERDGMYFLSEQVAEYDHKKMLSGLAVQHALFVFDEASAIAWLRKLLCEKPQSFQDINPLFMKELSGWKKNEKGLELSTLLEQNFLVYDGTGLVPEQIHAYLSTSWKDMRNLPKDDPALVAKAKGRWYLPDPNKAGDLEKLREKALLKEFEEYKEVKKKLKIFRLEAVRAGFKKAYQERDYNIIIAVAEKIPSNILEEDPKLLMWYDQAVTRMGDF